MKIWLKKRNSDDWWNNDKCRYECKKRHVYEKVYASNPAARNCENGKYFASIMDNSEIICDEVTESYEEETKTILTNFCGKSNLKNTKFLYFTWILINYYSIIDSC